MAERQWTDPAGGAWRLRGEKYRDLGRHKIEAMLRDPGVRVFLTDHDTAEEVPPADRPALWAQVRPYYLELVDRDATSDSTNYAFEEYVNDRLEHLLLVWRSC